jgi:hypothetical protein
MSLLDDMMTGVVEGQSDLPKTDLAAKKSYRRATDRNP